MDSIDEVRVLFDAIIEEYPFLSQYLSSDADIVHSPDFENGQVKLLSNHRDESKLTFRKIGFGSTEG